MAEFQEVIRERKRMCDSVENCNKCPLSGSPCEIDENILNNPSKIEEVIMQWAKEHPVKTNADKFKEVFGQSHSSVMDKLYDISIKNYEDFWKQEYKEPREV